MEVKRKEEFRHELEDMMKLLVHGLDRDFEESFELVELNIEVKGEGVAKIDPESREVIEPYFLRKDWQQLPGAWYDCMIDDPNGAADDEPNIYIRFGNRNDGFDDCFKQIRSRKDLVSVAGIIQERLRSNYRYKVSSYDKLAHQDEYYAYSAEFSHRILADWKFFALPEKVKGLFPSPDVLPIRFYWRDCRNDAGQIEPTTAGQVAAAKGFPFTIEIYNSDTTEPDSIKRTIRHEILHLYSMYAGVPYADESPVFWFLADYYDANPYKPMTPDDEKIYLELKQLPKEEAERRIAEMSGKIWQNIA